MSLEMVTSSQIPEDATKLDITDNVAANSNAQGLRGRKLTIALAFVTGTGFTLFGYDQGVMSALLTAKQFEKTFPQVIVDDTHPNHATLQSFVVAIYEIGCLFGALSNLWVGDKLGRRWTIAVGGIIMIIGAILQATAFSYTQMVIARIITGLGNGLNTSTVPSYHAETSPAANRGSLIIIEGSLITFGIMLSYVRLELHMLTSNTVVIDPRLCHASGLILHCFGLRARPRNGGPQSLCRSS
ncbi:hypothetical protein HGRIS_009729 [Hohenbuehelia grisea]|uniref:Major facilitator superfamily (MFS) profile domain-containing protein n=1 Tax=Hohenbuehelia grisea TaxID=104357 RepID=A0ABR3J297_9AGAR